MNYFDFLGLTSLFLKSTLFPSFVDKNVVLSHELDPTARYNSFLIRTIIDDILFLNRLPELDSGFFGRLELMCSENQYADEWIPVFISLLEMLRDTVHVRLRRKLFFKIFMIIFFIGE